MKIAVIGSGNVGGALAMAWANAGHEIVLGVQDQSKFKGQDLLSHPGIQVASIGEAVEQARVLLVAIPPQAIFSVLEQTGDLAGKVVMDATNSVGTRPDPFPTVYHALKDRTRAEVVKCFNSTGFENMKNPVYDGKGIDMFMAGDDLSAKEMARQLALDAGFGDCIDFGKGDKVELLEKFALSWINLAIMQGMGRNIAFKLVRR